RDDPARAVGRHRNLGGGKRGWSHRLAVEDQSAVPDRDRVAGNSDHALDEIRFLVRVSEHDDIAARRDVREDASVERRESEWKAVARETVGPFGDDQIVAD